jgi:signal transduction histidine kinase
MAGRSRVGGSVRLRITAAALLVAGVALGVSAVALLVLLHRSLVDGVDAQARLRLTDVVALVQRGEIPATLAGEDDGTVAQIMRGDTVVAQSPLITSAGPLAPVVPTGDAIVIRTVERAAVGDVGPYRVAARTVAAPGGGEVTVYAAASLEPAADAVQTLGVLLAVAIPLLTLLVGVATWRLVGRTLEPVEAIRREVSEISELSPGRRVPEPATGDEIARLARTMNEMLDRLDAAAARQRAFVSDASHELRSPMATIRTRLEVALCGAGVDWPVVARSVLGEQGRLERLVDDLLYLARTDEPAPPAALSIVDLDELILKEAADLHARGTVRVDVSAVAGGRVMGDRDRLRRMVGNLLDNAERHAASIVRCGLSATDSMVELVVSDDGPGIPAADRERIFDRFVRLDDARTRAGGGVGLGLSIVRETVQAHGGTVCAADAPAGARFVIRLPTAPGK